MADRPGLLTGDHDYHYLARFKTVEHRRGTIGVKSCVLRRYVDMSQYFLSSSSRQILGSEISQKNRGEKKKKKRRRKTNRQRHFNYFNVFRRPVDRCVSLQLIAYRNSWTLTEELQRRIQAVEMRCNCKIVHSS